MNLKKSVEVYSPQRKKEDKETFWVYYVTRPISFWVTPIFLKLGISANQASFFGIIVGVISIILIMAGSYWLVLAGALLLEFWLVIDSVDGTIARYRKTCSPFGKFIEQIDGALMSALFFSGIGVAASKMPGFLPFGVAINQWWFVILGIITSFFVIFRHLITLHYHAIFSVGKEFKPEPMYEASGFALLYKTATKFLGIYSLAQPLLILAVIFNLLGLYTIVYFLMHLAVMLGNIVFITMRAKREKQKI